MKTISEASSVLRNSRHRDVLLLLLFIAVLLARLLASPPIWHHGEAREGLVVQTIVHEHQWILPFRNGEVPSKPPLFHWIAALLANFCGLSDVTVRLPSAVAAVVVVIAIFLLGGEMDDHRIRWFAVGAFLGIYEFWDAATQARVDMVFAACLTGSLAGFFFWYRKGCEVSRSLCYLASAGAVLAKGPAGIVLPGVVIVVFLLLERRMRLLWKFWSWPLIGAVLLIDIGWYGLAYKVGGEGFLGVQLWRENIDRFLAADGFSTRFTNLDLVTWLATQPFPWNLALVWSVSRWLRGESEDSIGRFLHIWWMTIFGLFVVSTGKRAIYLLPMYPAIALIAARAIAQATSKAAGSSPQSKSVSLVKQRFWPTVRQAGVAIALLDLTILLLHFRLGAPSKRGRAALAFAEEINHIVPASRPLFASEELSNTELIVLAYRSGRHIERKSLVDGHRHDYFLTSDESADLQGSGMRVLVCSKINQVALISVLKPESSRLGNEGTKHFSLSAGKIDHPQSHCGSARSPKLAKNATSQKGFGRNQLAKQRRTP